MKLMIPIMLLLTGCNGVDVCEYYCSRQGAGLKQSSQGVCLCNNKEGLKAAQGYHALLDNKCNLTPGNE